MSGSLASLADPFDRKPIGVRDMPVPYRRCGYPHIGKAKRIPTFPAVKMNVFVEMAVFIAVAFATGEFYHPIRAEDPMDQPLLLETDEGPIDRNPVMVPF